MSYVFFGSAKAESMAARDAESVANEKKNYIRSFIGNLTNPANAPLFDTILTNGVHFDFTGSGLTVSIPVYNIVRTRVIPLAEKIVLAAGVDIMGLQGVQDAPIQVCCYPSEYGVTLEHAMVMVANLASLGTPKLQADNPDKISSGSTQMSAELLLTGKNFFVLPPADTDETGHYGCVITNGKAGLVIPDVFCTSGVRVLPMSEVKLSAIKEDALTVPPPVMLAIKGAVCRAFSSLRLFEEDFHAGVCEAHAYHYANHDTAVALVSRKSKLALRAPQFYKNCEDIELTTDLDVDIAEKVWHSVDLPALEEVAANMVEHHFQRIINSYFQIFGKQEKKNGKN